MGDGSQNLDFRSQKLGIYVRLKQFASVVPPSQNPNCLKDLSQIILKNAFVASKVTQPGSAIRLGLRVTSLTIRFSPKKSLTDQNNLPGNKE